MKVIYYKGYKIEHESHYCIDFERFESMFWIYGRSIDSGNWVAVSNSCKSIKEARAYIKEYLK